MSIGLRKNKVAVVKGVSAVIRDRLQVEFKISVANGFASFNKHFVPPGDKIRELLTAIYSNK